MTTGLNVHAPRTVVRIVIVATITLAALLVVRTWIASQIGYTPLLFAEPMPYLVVTVLTVALTSAAAGLLFHGWRSIVVSSLSAFAVYLGWAVLQQNSILNPDLWKLWERHWLTVAVACGAAALVLSVVVQSALSRLGHAKLVNN
jgi:hypothetical protein